ncbi:NAD(P)/FAD-dependent oxidoreductase [Nocardiopsis rhodophaea]|uniref:NAD(P)/FAD-dependent oxidoreductase n=1 Tax=Nocardiopsis rhodophaea TaxID=280238 RepID=A0ABP5EU37_9ACTN
MAGISDHYSVIVVGGGPAGACTAGLLAKRGHRVLVLERESFPRYHVGESMITGIVSILDQLDLTERLDRMGFPRKYGLSLVWGKDRTLWDVKFKEGGPHEYSYHVTRADFDQLLLTRARELGAHVVERATVKEPIFEGERVAGVRYSSPGAEDREVRSSLVIDASGEARTISRHLTDVTWHEDLQNLAIWSYFKGCGSLPEEQQGNILVEKVRDRNGWFWSIPLAGEITSVGYVAPTEDIRSAKKPTPDMFWENVDRTRELRGLMAGAVPVGDFRTCRDWSYISKRFHGPGWVAVGDAACFIDPLLSTGVCLGMLCSGALAYACGMALNRPEQEADIFQEYEQGARIFLTESADYVRFFYDSDRDREDYFELAHSMRASIGDIAPRQSFVALVSGYMAMSSLFDFNKFGTSDDIFAE